MAIRSFIALSVPDALANSLGDCAAQMAYQDKSNAVRWVDQANFHITLAFLGEQSEQDLYTLADQLDQRPGSPLWRRPEFSAAAAMLLVVAAVVAVVLARGVDTVQDPEPAVVSTVPAPTTTSSTTTTAPTTTTTTPTTTAPSTSAPPTTIGAAEAAWLELPTWGTSSADAGTYRSFNFLVPLSFTVEDGWTRLPNASELTNAVTPMLPPSGIIDGDGGLTVYRHDPIYDGEFTAQEWADRVVDHPFTDVESVEDSSIDGVPSTRIRFRITARFVYTQMNAELLQGFEPGEVAVIEVLEVDGETLSVTVFAQDDDDLDALMAVVQPIIDSIDWRNEPRVDG